MSTPDDYRVTAVRGLIRTLYAEARQERLLAMRSLGMSLAKAGIIEGISRERVRQLTDLPEKQKGKNA